jgi:cytochrome c peroxidase
MKKNTFLATATGFFAALIIGCASDDILTTSNKTLQLPAQPYDYSVNLPQKFVEKLNGGGLIIDDAIGPIFNGSTANIPNNIGTVRPVMNFQGISVSDEGATLGRVLFYDTQLSINNAVACASCHKQADAFADKGLAGSIGFGGKVTPRNSMAICNVGFNNNLFWDSRTQSVRDLVLQPIQNHIEMGMEEPEKLVTKLSAIDYYPELFAKTYGDPEITTDRISDAVSQFLVTMVSCNSKFDEGENSEFANFSPLEKMGHQLFFSDKAKCGQCHTGANFSAPDGFNDPYGGPTIKGTANIGLAINYKDNGKGNGHFKIPSLRNIALTAPYMHDGSLQTLEEVVEHYNSGIQAHNELDNRLKPGNAPQRLNLSNLEKQALVAFLHTLSDESIVKDPKFSNPFN